MRTVLLFGKFILPLFFLVSSVTTFAQNYQQLESLPWIRFSWTSDTISGRLVEKTSMSIPLKIEDIPYAFDAQFDLGAVSSMIYGRTFAPYLAEQLALQKRITTDKSVMIEGVTYPCLRDISISLDGVAFTKRDITLFKDFGDVMTEDSIQTPTVKHIGTIAADLFNDKILLIDYKNQRLCSVTTLPTVLESKMDFVAIDYIKENNWIFLPLQIGDSICKVIFDTGSSLFPLISTPAKISRITNNVCADSLHVTSWGNEETVHGYLPNVKISLANNICKTLPVYSSSNSFDDESLDQAGFWGIVGNRYFLDKVVAIDYKNKRFGILKE